MSHQAAAAATAAAAAYPSCLSLAQGLLILSVATKTQLLVLLIIDGEGVGACQKPYQDTAQAPAVLALEADLPEQLIAVRLQVVLQDLRSSISPS